MPPARHPTSDAIGLGIEWIDFVTGFLLFAFFVYQKRVKGRCKFEVLYVTGVGTFTDWMKIFIVDFEPATFTIKETGKFVNWSRWVGWLITCPVILIHLSNLAGREVFDTRRLMKMFIGYQIMTVSGATASMTATNVKWFFAVLSWFSLAYIFKYALEIFQEAIVTMPARAKPYLHRMMALFFVTWAFFGVSFCIGPEMLELLDVGTTRAAYAFLDILSKSGYAYHGWYIRWNILRKFNKPEEFVDEIKDDDDQKEYKVLLIEKDEVFAYFFYNTLQQQECKVDTVKDVEEATEKIGNVIATGTQYDIILINHDLAKENNYVAMTNLRRVAFMLPVIAYGRNISPEDVNNRSATGIDDFLVAPFPDQEISKKFMKWSRRMSMDPRRMSVLPFGSANAHMGGPIQTMGANNPVLGSALSGVIEKSQPSAEKPAEDNIASKLSLLMDQLTDMKSSQKEATDTLTRRMEAQERKSSPMQQYNALQSIPQQQQSPMPPQQQQLSMPPQQQQSPMPPQQQQQQSPMPSQQPEYQQQQQQYQQSPMPPYQQYQYQQQPQQASGGTMTAQMQQFLVSSGVRPSPDGGYTFI